ncbi:hypothetical protein NECAME_13238 [Necator americanus]|uniref:Protein HGH1 homolog n=1 Tax=Necator americanus TaxID=51031 RepID=W2SWB8_NECAM|nr:hypothetical protein NECAME_13238 [Necator americanus]ETN74054.1 hypothetical protein NECAME_13238 [Necator americanus]
MEDTEDDNKATTELIGFLTPTTRLDVRRAALDYVIAVSGVLDGSASRLFLDNDYAMGEAVCKLCENTLSDRSHTLSALTNFSSGSAEVANYILSRSKCAQLAFDACRSRAPFANFGARLLANLSRHFPVKVADLLTAQEEKALDILVELFVTRSEDSFSSLIGYTLVNFSTLSTTRHSLVNGGLLPKICSVISVDEKKSIAADILRNLAFEDSLHQILLDENDMYLLALLVPLADSEDELNEEETQKLPLRLQYYEGKREDSVEVRQKLVEALYQLCATKHSRELLRRRGVYAILRELDKATGGNEKSQPGLIGEAGMQLLTAQQEHTLHALIGILIRHEEEMAIESNVESLRLLQ